MRYFMFVYRANKIGASEIYGNLTCSSEEFPSNRAIKKSVSEQPENKALNLDPDLIVITNFVEFKSEQDHKDFTK